MREGERRNIATRAAVVQRVINGVVQNPSVTLTVETLQKWLNIPMDAASASSLGSRRPGWSVKSRRVYGHAARGLAHRASGSDRPLTPVPV